MYVKSIFFGLGGPGLPTLNLHRRIADVSQDIMIYLRVKFLLTLYSEHIFDPFIYDCFALLPYYLSRIQAVPIPARVLVAPLRACVGLIEVSNLASSSSCLGVYGFNLSFFVIIFKFVLPKCDLSLENLFREGRDFLQIVVHTSVRYYITINSLLGFVTGIIHKGCF